MTDIFCVDVQFYIKHSWPLTRNRKTLKSAYKCKHTHKHTCAHTNTHMPCGQKASLWFYGSTQWEGLLGWTVTALLCSECVCVCACVHACVCQVSREGGAHHVTSCLWKQLAFTRICCTDFITNTHRHICEIERFALYCDSHLFLSLCFLSVSLHNIASLFHK